LGTQPAYSLMGQANPTDLNAAKMRNSGVELTAGYSKVGNNFTFNVSGNAAFITNEISKLYTENTAYFAGGNQDYGAGNITRTIAGSSIQHFYLSETDGIFQNEGEIVNGEGKPTQEGLVLPLNPDGTVDMVKWQDPANSGKYTRPGDIRFTGKMKDMGSFLPKVSYGLNLSATFKGFDVTMFIQGVSGNKIYNGTRVITEGMQRLFNSGTEVMDAWTPSNTDTNVPRAVSGDPNANARPSDRFLENGSYLRIKNLNIGYSFPASLLSFTNGTVKRFRIYFTAQNLLTVTNYKGYDPEVGNRNINNFGDNNRFLVNGIDYGQFPQPRTFIGGVQLGF
ncbi:MAG TPA: SusC/RagA family TonB-linked outer membrane protein, partial [Cyclobacteriaceae bacterium]|nr:SusC/RagA family TonB-linked outer membrane protein [Cyclobacteriaceae bacterium]